MTDRRRPADDRDGVHGLLQLNKSTCPGCKTTEACACVQCRQCGKITRPSNTKQGMCAACRSKEWKECQQAKRSGPVNEVSTCMTTQSDSSPGSSLHTPTRPDSSQDSSHNTPETTQRRDFANPNSSTQPNVQYDQAQLLRLLDRSQQEIWNSRSTIRNVKRRLKEIDALEDVIQKSW